MVRPTAKTQLVYSERILGGCVPHRESRNKQQHQPLSTENNPHKPQFGWCFPEWIISRMGHQIGKAPIMI